jgi:cupredoxin-like protein
MEISRMRYILPFPLIITALLTSVTALAADDIFELSLKDHQFTPSQLSIPADKRVKLTIKNLDSTPAEFESQLWCVRRRCRGLLGGHGFRRLASLPRNPITPAAASHCRTPWPQGSGTTI